MVLEKRFSEYETMGELFENMEEDLIVLTLWKRVLSCIERFLGKSSASILVLSLTNWKKV